MKRIKGNSLVWNNLSASIPEGVDMNTYNAGGLISMNINALRTNGFNQWDEQWEVGTISGRTGENSESTNNIRSANFIRILPNTTYYFKCPLSTFITVICYDDNKQYIKAMFWGEYGNKTITTPTNASYIKIATHSNYGPTYNNDICINLSHSGVRDGEYEPYKEFTHDLSWIKRHFPNGMKSAGSVYDEINEHEVIQRIGEVDLGSLDWENSSQSNYTSAFRAPLTGAVDNQVTSQYTLVSDSYFTSTWVPDSLPNSINIYNGYIGINDPRYSDVASFKEAMKGLIINYALVEPIVTPMPARAINLNYPVWDWGTERAVSDVPSAPFRADIIYGFNAVDTIRTNKLDIANILRRLAELEAKLAPETINEE
jgi:hypothetical protein